MNNSKCFLTRNACNVLLPEGGSDVVRVTIDKTFDADDDNDAVDDFAPAATVLYDMLGWGGGGVDVNGGVDNALSTLVWLKKRDKTKFLFAF